MGMGMGGDDMVGFLHWIAVTASMKGGMSLGFLYGGISAFGDGICTAGMQVEYGSISLATRSSPGRECNGINHLRRQSNSSQHG